MKIASKGYTLIVESYESDGDNFRTETYTFESKDLAIAIAKMCTELFGREGIGNWTGKEEDAETVIVNYMHNHPEVYPDRSNMNDNQMIDHCMNWNSLLLGYSEYYYSRFTESVTLYYSPQDIYVEEIKIN